MTMAKSAGINENAASDMAVTLAGLTGDVASFYNISQNLADVRLKSVFTGETETLKRARCCNDSNKSPGLCIVTRY